MPKRLAITISGAVSLGSYEAGVLYEVITALGQHNQSAATEDDKIYIDVLTGASAGGMTAAIAAQKLLYEARSLDGPELNAFYRPWVLDVSIQALLKLNAAEPSTHSIFSSDLIEIIAARYLTKRYQSHIPVAASDRERHPAAAERISLGLAMSNLNGVNYTKLLRTGGAFAYTCHQDEVNVDFLADGSDGHDSGDLWEFLRGAAVACGAFPFAFRVRDLFRRQVEYPGADPFPTPVQQFTYTDGGVFENEPLGMAKNLVDKIDFHQGIDSRFYLFVAPGARSGSQKLAFHENDADFWTVAQRTAASVFDQACFHDWVTAEEVNEKIALFNRRAEQLRDDLSGGVLHANALQTGATALLPLLFKHNPSGETQAAAWKRVQAQFQSDYDELQKKIDKATADTFIDSLLTFETVAQLGTKDEMNIYGIIAADEELASFEVSAFAGFFDQRYRQHDYDVGRAKARAFLTDPVLSQPGQLGPIRYPHPPATRVIDKSLDNLKLEHMDRQIREQFRDRLRDRAHAVMAEIGVPTSIVRETIDLALIKPQLDKLLKL